MRRAARTDNVQAALVADLERMGFTVALTFQIGEGFVDLVVGKGGIDILVEVKNGPKDKLTPAEIKFHADWRGAPVLVAYDAEMVLAEWLRRSNLNVGLFQSGGASC